MPWRLAARSRGRALAAGVLLLGGSTGGILVAGNDASAAAVVETATREQMLARYEAAVLATSRAEVLADAEESLPRARAALVDSVGKVDETLRDELGSAIRAVDAALAMRDRAAVIATMQPLRESLKQVRDALDAYDAAAARTAADARRAHLAAQQEAERATAAQEAARVAHEQAAALAAADQERARIATEQAEAAGTGPAAPGAVIGRTGVAQTPAASPPATVTAAPSSHPAARTIEGTLRVRQGVSASSVSACGGYERFASFIEGALVTVTDAQGKQVGTGRLSGCTWVDAGARLGLGDQHDRFYDAVFSYAVPVTEDGGAYVIHIGGLSWPPVAEVDLRVNRWRSDLAVE